MEKFSVERENDEIVSIKVDGVKYDSLDQIPDPEVRARILEMISDAEQAKEEALEDTFDIAGIIFKFFPVIFFAIGVLMLGSSVFSAVNKNAELSKPGRVTNLVMGKDETGKSVYYPVVEVNLPNGNRQTVQLSEGSSPAAYKPGDEVTILYDPAYPNKTRIKSIWNILTMLNESGAINAAIFGVLFLAQSIWLYLKFTKDLTQQAEQE